MAFALELLFQVVLEVVAYGVGRAVLLVVAPRCGVETQVKSPKAPKSPWTWRGFSFMRAGKRYFYVEAVQVVGLAVILGLIVIVVLANNYLK